MNRDLQIDKDVLARCMKSGIPYDVLATFKKIEVAGGEQRLGVLAMTRDGVPVYALGAFSREDGSETFEPLAMFAPEAYIDALQPAAGGEA